MSMLTECQSGEPQPVSAGQNNKMLRCYTRIHDVCVNCVSTAINPSWIEHCTYWRHKHICHCKERCTKTTQIIIIHRNEARQSNEKALKTVRYQSTPQTSCHLLLTRDTTKIPQGTYRSTVLLEWKCCSLLISLVKKAITNVPHKNKTENFLAKRTIITNHKQHEKRLLKWNIEELSLRHIKQQGMLFQN